MPDPATQPVTQDQWRKLSRVLQLRMTVRKMEDRLRAMKDELAEAVAELEESKDA